MVSDLFFRFSLLVAVEARTRQRKAELYPVGTVKQRKPRKTIATSVTLTLKIEIQKEL